jgi:ketosteroid isomerase-like protein
MDEETIGRSANLDLVRSIMANVERGDWSDYLGAAEWAHPEIQWVIAEGPTAGSWTGVAAMVQSVRGMLEAWQELRFYAAEYRELDRERILVLGRISGRAKMSGLPVTDFGAKGAGLSHFRDGKVTRQVIYYDGDRALADLGLTRAAGSQR